MASLRRPLWRPCLVLLVVFTSSILSLSTIPRVTIVGGGISGLLVGHVLQQSGRFQVTVLEASDRLGGNIRQLPDPNDSSSYLNIGHATHLGMFWNLRLLLRYLKEQEWPVGRSSEPGIFRMISVVTEEGGARYQPALADLLSLSVWWDALRFYYHSHFYPDMRLDEFIQRHQFSKTFLNTLYWSMATFEFDKSLSECDAYAVGTCRALLITQVFFKFLLLDAFNGVLPRKLQEGLRDDLMDRVLQNAPTSQHAALREVVGDLSKEPLASYCSADYSRAMQKLAEGAGDVRVNCNVTSITRDLDSNTIRVESGQGNTFLCDVVVLTVQPYIIESILNTADFAEHVKCLNQIESGAVGVSIVHANDLPFIYPPRQDINPDTVSTLEAPTVLGIFDISELTTTATGQQQAKTTTKKAGWLSIAYPVYSDDSLNRHLHWIRDKSTALDTTVYPWTKATAEFVKTRQELLVKLQGTKGVYITGHTFTGVNKASELQVYNALKLCRKEFGVDPPWGHVLNAPLLPDCNDEDAFHKANSPLEAARLAVKNFIGSFLLVGVVHRLGKDVLD